MTIVQTKIGTSLWAVAALLPLACSTSHGPGDPPRPGVDGGDSRCAATRECVVPDALGCCEGGAVARVSVCNACPPSTIERSMCNPSACTGGGCGGRPPIGCHSDVGNGCCGPEVVAGSIACGACGPGQIPATECNVGPECSGCMTDIADPPLGDGGAGGGARPAIFCHVDLGSGCGCGEMVGTADFCGVCPAGTIPSHACGAAIVLPAEPCFADLGGGCCGAAAGATGCCPPGTLRQSACAGFAAGGALPAPRPFPIDGGIDLPPPPPVSCRADFGGGCCGEEVMPNACGSCPIGAVPSFQCSARQWTGVPPAPAPEPRPADFIAPPPDGGTGGAAPRPVPADGGAGVPVPPPPPQVTCFADVGNGCCGEALCGIFGSICPPGTLAPDACSTATTCPPR